MSNIFKAFIVPGKLLRKGNYIRIVSRKRYRRMSKRYYKSGGQKGYLAEYI